MSAPADGFRVDVMAEADVALAVDWAAAEGWNPGLSDAACFRAADPGGFLVGRLDGVPVATISVVRYGTSFAFLGLYIVVQLPQAAGWVLGTFLAIELIFQGWAYVALARAIRSTFDGVHPRPAA